MLVYENKKPDTTVVNNEMTANTRQTELVNLRGLQKGMYSIYVSGSMMKGTNSTSSTMFK